MHFARRVRFGAGLHLLNVIREDNRQVTTRSLMALFSRSKPRRQRDPSKLCQQECPCIHHGPHSFHATSECRDPTLSRSKKAQPRAPAKDPKLAGIAPTTPAPLAPDHVTDSMAHSESTSHRKYSPIFLTQVSSAARRDGRTQFIPRRKYRQHLLHGRH